MVFLVTELEHSTVDIAQKTRLDLVLVSKEGNCQIRFRSHPRPSRGAIIAQSIEVWWAKWVQKVRNPARNLVYLSRPGWGHS